MGRIVKIGKHRHYAFFIVIRHIVFLAKLVGTFPITVKNWDPSYFKFGLTFEFQFVGLLFTILQLFVILYMIRTTYVFFIVATKSYSPLLLQVMYVCGLSVVRSCLQNSFSFAYRTRQAIDILNSATVLFSDVKIKSKQKARMILGQVYFLIFFGSLSIVMRIVEGYSITACLAFAANNLQEISIEFIFVTLLTMIKLMLMEVNERLKTIGTSKNLEQLEALSKRHWRICHLLDCLQDCFGLDIALQLCFNLGKSTLLAYYCYFIYKSYAFKISRYTVSVIDMMYRFFIVWYLGYKTDQVTFQRKETRRILTIVLIENFNDLDRAHLSVVNMFLTRVLCRPPGFTVCDMFQLDRGKLYSVVQMVFTYVIIMIQFQSFM